jgi:histidinol phosphatase-like enzyme
MNRFEYLLTGLPNNTTNQIIGLFPFGTVIDTKNTSIKNQQLHFLEEGVEFLQKISTKNISVVLFFNQFRPPVPMNELEQFAAAVSDFVTKQGVNVIGPYWCPGIDKKDPFVVPNPGMFTRVTENTGIKWDNITVISTNELDLMAAAKVKALPVKIGGTSTKWTAFASLADWVNLHKA